MRKESPGFALGMDRENVEEKRLPRAISACFAPHRISEIHERLTCSNLSEEQRKCIPRRLKSARRSESGAAHQPAGLREVS